MSDRKITVLNPAGYQEIFQSGDNLLVDGSVNLQSNGLTGVPAPGADTDAANKEYVDEGDNANQTQINDLDGRLDSLEDRVDNTVEANDSSVTITGAGGLVVTGDNPFTLNSTTDVNLTLTAPTVDLSGFLEKPGSNGDFIIVEDNGDITYSSTIDGGTYAE